MVMIKTGFCIYPRWHLHLLHCVRRRLGRPLQLPILHEQPICYLQTRCWTAFAAVAPSSLPQALRRSWAQWRSASPVSPPTRRPGCPRRAAPRSGCGTRGTGPCDLRGSSIENWLRWTVTYEVGRLDHMWPGRQGLLMVKLCDIQYKAAREVRIVRDNTTHVHAVIEKAL